MSTQSESNLAIAKAFYTAFDSKNPDQMNELFAEHAIDHDGQTGDEPALPNMRGLVTALAGGFSNYKHQLQLLLPVDDMVVIRWRMTGTHSGDFFGAPASGKNIAFHGHDVIKVENGKIVELWHIEQLLQMFHQFQN